MKKNLKNIYVTFFSLFCAVVPFTDLGEAIPNIALLVLLVLFPFVVQKEDWKKILDKRFYTLYFLIFLVTIQLVIFSRLEDFKFVSTLLLVILVLIISIPIKNKLIPILSFIYGSLALLIVSTINLVSHYMLSGQFNMTVGDHVSSILLGDRPYIGYVYVLSFCMCLYVATQISKAKFLYYVLALLFLVFLLIISARISLISIVVVVLSYLFYTKNLKKVGLIIIVLTLFSIIMFTVNPSLKKRFFISNNNHSFEQIVKFEPRYFIWSCANEIFFNNKNYFVGKGFVVINNELESCYVNRLDFADKKQQDFFVRSKFNTHNQFINFLLSSGILIFLIFIIFFLLWLKLDYKSYYSFILLISLILFCSVENVLARQMGAELFALTLIFSTMISSNIKNSEGHSIK
ncbi:O-antigen ligase family protein [Winogradskyella helgolandensis]|uniref:O-antigen ligase family protein n=1 Tax=Winogradskyella helgolandensis TaxID=2697010 RepID=UPI0015C78699|nr:O-antigen ligase family protein [Winogradskyella helgolandensis]